MDVRAIPGMVGRLRRSAGPFQRTFQTPLDRLPAFAATLLASMAPVTAATLTVEAIVFTPKHLERLLARHNLPHELRTDSTIAASGGDEALSLLEAALGDWVDFYFVPEPGALLVYADHDEYTTVFAPAKGRLARLGAAMAEAGFAEVTDYSRAL